MTVSTTENIVENTLNQQKVDTNLAQPQVDVNSTQKPEDNKGEEAKEDPNWRAFREARKQDRIQKEQAEKRAAEKEAEVAALKAAMEAAFSKNNPSQQPFQTDYDHEETEDERIEKKVQAAIAQREAASERARMEREQQEYPQRLVQQYPDFNAMISSENLDYLDYHYPEVSIPLKRQADGFDKWSDIYKAIKKFVPNGTTAKKEAAKADNNFAKPKSMSSTSITQPGESAGSARLSDERRAANWERMQRIMKGVS